MAFEVVHLSQDFGIHTPAFASYDGPSIKWVKRLAFDRVGGQELTSTLHVGTHLDAPSHFHSGGKSIGELPLESRISAERSIAASTGECCSGAFPGGSKEARLRSAGRSHSWSARRCPPGSALRRSVDRPRRGPAGRPRGRWRPPRVLLEV